MEYQISEKIPQQIKKKVFSKKLFIIIATLLIIFGIAGVGLALYTHSWDPKWNPFRPSPEKVFKEMVGKMREVKTLHSDLNLEMEFEIDKETKRGFKTVLTLSEDTDQSDPSLLKAKNAGEFKINFSSEGMDVFGKMKYISIGREENYFKITTLPTPIEEFLSLGGIDTNLLKKNWIKIDKESIQKFQEDLLKELSKDLSPWERKQIEKQLEIQKKIKEKQKELIEKITSIFQKKRLFVIKKELLDEKIQNKATYHYLVTLDKKELKEAIYQSFGIIYEEFLEELLRERISTLPTSLAAPFTLPSKEEFLEKLSKPLNEILDKISEIEGEIWIGKKDRLLYKIRGEKEIDLSKFQKESEKECLEPECLSLLEGIITIKLDLSFSKFNQPMKIEPPANFKTLKEIFPPSFIPPFTEPPPFSPEYQEEEDWKELGL